MHTDYTLPTNHSSEHFLSGTNGIAAGNHLLEALSAGICELIEHDAVALWNARGIRERARCRLDLASIDDDDCRALLETYERAGAVPRVWGVTSDTNIAVFVCDIPAETNGLRRFRGAGCHPNRAVALARALTEAAQIRLDLHLRQPRRSSTIGLPRDRTGETGRRPAGCRFTSRRAALISRCCHLRCG